MFDATTILLIFFSSILLILTVILLSQLIVEANDIRCAKRDAKIISRITGESVEELMRKATSLSERDGSISVGGAMGLFRHQVEDHGYHVADDQYADKFGRVNGTKK